MVTVVPPIEELAVCAASPVALAAAPPEEPMFPLALAPPMLAVPDAPPAPTFPLALAPAPLLDDPDGVAEPLAAVPPAGDAEGLVP
jgi:hypothetical protein